MKITVESNSERSDVLEIKSACHIGDYEIRISFNDDVDRVVDFRSFLENSIHPSIRKYLDEHKFKEFEIIDGNLNWNDYDLIFPIYDLYQGKV